MLLQDKNEDKSRGNAPIILSSTLFVFLGFCFAIPLIAIVVVNVRTKKRKKALAFTVVYENQLLSLRGEAQRQPWKDREGSPTNYLGDEYFGVYARESSVPSIGLCTFCNKISLTIKNEGILPIDTDVSKEPLGFNLDVRGKLNSIKVLDVEPANERLDLSIKDVMVLLNHVHLEPGKSFQLLFLGWFAEHYEKRVYD
jgi:hypothetical protein